MTHPRFLALTGSLLGIGVALAGSPSSPPLSSQWPQFRGPGGNAIASGQSIPLSFGPEKNVRWKTAVPTGASSPCIWGDRIFLTAHDGLVLKMLCLARTDGKVLWERERRMTTQPHYEHVAGDAANSTPATDGRLVVFYFDDFGMVVTDLAGAMVWEKRFAPIPSGFGYGASPILDDGRIYLNRDGGLDSGLVCLEAGTGREQWRAARSNVIASFCTPYVWRGGGETRVLAGGTGRLDAYDARTGEPVWNVTGLPAFICPSPVAAGDRILFGGWTTAHVAGRSRVESVFEVDSGVSAAAMKDPAAFIAQFDANHDGRLSVAEFPSSRARDAFSFVDKNQDGFVMLEEWAPLYAEQQWVPGRNVLLGIVPGGRGDVTETHVKWEATKGLPYVASPLAYQGRVYLAKTGGFLTCLDLETGRVHYESERLGVAGEYYATPVAVGEHILVCAQRGTVFAVKAGDRMEIAARNDLGEPVAATPAIVDNTVYLRGENHLWAFGK